jgi:hypothetical protein
MSISINKLMNLAGNDSPSGVDKKKFGTKELPDKMKGVGATTLTESQYYNSVKGNRMPKNVANILQLGTPDGSNASPGNKTVQVPIFSRPDGAIDPNRIRSLTDPNSAQPYAYAGYGLEGGVKFGSPNTVKVSRNSIGLLRKAQMSYQNRQSILEPRKAAPSNDESQTPSGKPPSYDESMGDLKPYKNTDSELNETYS